MKMTMAHLTELDAHSEVTVPVGEPSLASLFERSSTRHHDRIAVTVGSQNISYGELSIAANHVADSLLALHLPANALVAIYLDRSVDMVITMLGVIRAGAAYLPIDPNYPEARVRETIADAAPAAVITDAQRSAKLSDITPRVLVASNLQFPQTAPPQYPQPKSEDLAYVIYTSGSTGRPKGVMVTHNNVVRLLERTQHWFHFDRNDVWTMFHSFAFDFSVWEMWACLLTGGRLVIVPFAVSRSPEDFYNLLADEKVTVLNQTPTAFSLLIQAEARVTPRPLALRYVIFGGEALNLRSLLPWFERHGDATPQLINMYGITETTVHVTYRRILASEAASENDSLIGEPIPDLRLHLLDDALKPVPAGETGEICIGGPGVARGYLGRPELTAERFIADPLSLTGGRLYRSGDLARYRADGELVYLGRADRQVKINGFRIELGEIEAVLTTCPDVAHVCVIAHNDELAGQRLAAYFVANATSQDANAIIRYAEQHLPAHMRPAFYTRMEQIPLNNNGKVDRDALPAPRRQVPASTPSNANELETQIATIWKQVLRTSEIGLNDNFFDVGGSSLLLITLRGELQAALQKNIPVTWLFEHTTIHSFAAQMTREEQSPAASSAQTDSQSKAQQQRNSFARMRALRGATR